MKFTAKLILILLVIPLFLIGVLLASVRFQLLSPDFWQTTFRTNNVYSTLATALKNTAEQETVKKGGSLQEARILTSLITPGILQDLLEKNIVNFLNFANGKAREAIIYIPIKALPKSLLPTNLGKITENTPLTILLDVLHIERIQESQIESLSKTGQTVTLFLILDLVVLLLILIGIFLLTDKGKRYIPPALAFIIAGIIVQVLALLGYIVRTSMFTDWVKSTEPSQIILAPFAPYVLGEIVKVWAIIGAFAIVGGIVLIFFKRK